MAATTDPLQKVIFYELRISSFSPSSVQLEYSYTSGIQPTPNDFIGVVTIGENDPNKSLLKRSINKFLVSRGIVMFDIEELCKDRALDFQFIYVDSFGNIIGRSFDCHLEKCGSRFSSEKETKAVVPMQEYEQLLLKIIQLSEEKQKLFRITEKEKNNNVSESLLSKCNGNEDSVKFDAIEIKKMEKDEKELKQNIKDIQSDIRAAKSTEDRLRNDISNCKKRRVDLEVKLKPEEVVCLESLFDLQEKCEAMEKSIELILRNLKIQNIIKSELQRAIVNLRTMEKELKTNLHHS